MSDDPDNSELVPWGTSRYQKGSGPASFMRLQQVYTAPAEQVLAQYRASYPRMQALYKRLREEGFVSDGMDGWQKTGDDT
jgi:hypothetical protein